MCHAALAHIVHGRLVHGEVGAEQPLGVDGVKPQHAREILDVTCELLPHIARHVAAATGLERRHGSALEHLDRHVEHAHARSAHDGIHPANAHDALEGTRVARYRDEIDVVVGMEAHIALLEFLRGDVLLTQDAHRLGILALHGLGSAFLDGELVPVDLGMLAHDALKVKRRRRLTEAGAQHMVHVGHHVCAAGIELLGRLTVLSRAAKNRRIAMQQAEQVLIHLLGIFCARGLGHHALGNQAPLLDEVGSVSPFAAVGSRPVKQQGDRAVIKGTIYGGDDVHQERIGLLELVVEHVVCLRELEIIDIERAADLRAQRIQGGEQPAATALALVRHGLGRFHSDTVRIGIRAHGDRVAGCRHHVDRRHRIARDAVRPVLREFLG